MNKSAVVTGAGSGVGRAVAIALFQQGWKVAVVGRRQEALAKTCELAGASSQGEWLQCPCDIGDHSAVLAMANMVLKKFQTVEVLVNAAGTNVPKRSLELLSLSDYRSMLDTNIHGAYYCLQAFLPTMRQQHSGTIVNIGSEAALQASPKSGPAYVISKFGLRGLTQSINAEERVNGIRACSILPGDIDTPLLDKRPAPPTAEARTKMLKSEDVAACALLAITLPDRAIVEEILIRPR
jgi:NADP-dependent 3-hydroxy acid dehydrogenase YdfG